MNKPTKRVVSAIAYLIATVVSISLFGLFSAWSMSELNPAQQEAVAATTTPWTFAQRESALDESKPDAAEGADRPSARPVPTSVSTRR